MSRLIRSIALALALLVLCSSATYAFPSTERLPQEGCLAALWDRVIAWFAPGILASQEEGRGEKAGSSMDPNGVSLNTTSPESADSEAGSSMDPNGNT